MSVDVTKLAGTGANDGGSGVAWTSPGNITADDSFVAQVSLSAGQESQYLYATNFGFSIPSGATIEGVIARFSRYGMGTVTDKHIYLMIDGEPFGSGSDLSSGATWPFSETLDGIGGPTETWGFTPTAADVNHVNFGVALKCESAAGATAIVDVVEMIVYYSGGVVNDSPRIEGVILRRSPFLPRPMPYQSVILDVGTDVVESLDVWEEPSTIVSILREPPRQPKPLVILTDVALIAASTPTDSTPGQVPMVVLAIPSRPPARGPALAILTQFVTAGQGEVCLCPFGAVIVARGFATATLVSTTYSDESSARPGYSAELVSSRFATAILIKYVCHC